jgi:hypothetical protein
MSHPEISLAELTKFGIQPADEAIHPWSPDHEWWNESWFWDWFDAGGRRAGHCRFGLHPNQRRAWLWFYLYRDGEWIAVEEPRLPLADVRLPELEYQGWGLRFSWRPEEPLRRGRLRVSGFGRVLSGPRAGFILPVAADLEVRGIGALHSPGPSDVPGHSAAGYVSSRFEQPIVVEGALDHGGERADFAGRGERDHSWGPRPWNMEWIFTVLNGEDFRLQCAEVKLPEVGRVAVGYLHRRESQSLSDVELGLDFDDQNVLKPVAGRLSVKAEDGSVLSGRMESVSGAEIDITHCFAPPQRSVYRRALMRFTPDAGGASCLGWTESNRFG